MPSEDDLFQRLANTVPCKNSEILLVAKANRGLIRDVRINKLYGKTELYFILVPFSAFVALITYRRQNFT